MKHLSWLYILLILAGCTDTSLEGISTHSNEEFYATIEGSDSRTYVDDQIRLRWTAEDCITIFKKTTYNREFMFTGVTGANAGGFKQKSVDDDFWYGADVPYNYAVYPHSSTTQLDETDHFFTLTMPSEQTYVENSFGLGANTMVAVSESGQLMFKNVGSYLRVRLYGKDIAVSSITLASRGNEAIAGKAKVTPTLNGNPTCEMTGTGKSIRLTCPEPVTISEDADNPTDFWIVVPPVTLANGFSVTVENDKDDTQVFEVAKSFTFERNMYTNMVRGVAITDDDTIPYVTFKADAEQTLTMSKAVETLEYSIGGGEWTELGTNTVIFGGNNGDLRLRGKSSFGTYTNSYGGQSLITFGNSTKVACSGDIRTLVNYEDCDSADTSSARFFELFKNCSVLTSAPELPATTLASECYSSMFYGCTSLVAAPALPATKLASQSYRAMFMGCTGLTSAPELPATDLADGCYWSMFSGCKNLNEAPVLPALTLKTDCYVYMFYGCTALTSAPELPATIVTKYCYSQMFEGCTELVSAPVLPAVILVDFCYHRMFYGCSSLNKITMWATSITRNSLQNWVTGVASSGTFTKADNVSLPTGDSGIPSGWTIKDYSDNDKNDGPENGGFDMGEW